VDIPSNLWLALGFFFLGLERFVPNIPPWIAGIIFLVLGILMLIAVA
jgi:hypothetical protein